MSFFQMCDRLSNPVDPWTLQFFNLFNCPGQKLNTVLQTLSVYRFASPQNHTEVPQTPTMETKTASAAQWHVRYGWNVISGRDLPTPQTPTKHLLLLPLRARAAASAQNSDCQQPGKWALVSWKVKDMFPFMTVFFNPRLLSKVSLLAKVSFSTRGVALSSARRGAALPRQPRPGEPSPHAPPSQAKQKAAPVLGRPSRTGPSRASEGFAEGSLRGRGRAARRAQAQLQQRPAGAPGAGRRHGRGHPGRAVPLHDLLLQAAAEAVHPGAARAGPAALAERGGPGQGACGRPAAGRGGGRRGAAAGRGAGAPRLRLDPRVPAGAGARRLQPGRLLRQPQPQPAALAGRGGRAWPLRAPGAAAARHAGGQDARRAGGREVPADGNLAGRGRGSGESGRGQCRSHWPAPEAVGQVGSHNDKWQSKCKNKRGNFPDLGENR